MSRQLMKKSFHGSLRTRLLVLILLAVLPALGSTLYMGISHRRLMATQVKSEAMRLVRLISDGQRHLVDGTQELLISLASMDAIRRLGPRPCNEMLGNLLIQYHRYSNFGVADTRGNVFCSAVPISKPVSIPDRSYFRDALRTQEFSIGSYQTDRILNKPTVNFAYPLLTEDRQVKGVVFAAIDLAWFNLLASEAKLPQGSTLTIRDANGTIISRYPDPEKWVGKTVSDVSIVREIMSRQAEGTTEATGVDGIRRLYAFTLLGKTDNKSVYLSIGIPTDTAFGDANHELILTLLGLGVAFLLTVAVAWFAGDIFISRRIGNLLHATRRLAAGDLSARSGPAYGQDELGELTRAFDEMATSLEQRTSQLHQAEVKYRTLVEQIPAVTYIISLDDISYQFLYISPQIKPLLGFSPEEWMADPELWLHQIHPEDRERVLAEVHRSRTHEEPLRCDFRFVHRGGHVLWIRDEAEVIRVEDHPPVLQGIMRDVTERKTAEEERLRLATAVEQAEETIFIADRHGTIRYVNPAFERVSGYRCEEVIGQHPSFLRSGKHDEAFFEKVWGDLTQGKIWKGRIINRRKDGSLYEVETTLSPIRNESGHIINYVAVSRDVTEETKMRKYLQQAQKMEAIGTLAGGIAHDFNNILSAIVGYTEMTLVNITREERIYKYQEQVLKACYRARDLVNQILTFSRHKEQEKKPIQMELIVKEALKLMRASLPSTIKVHQEFSNVPNTVLADPTQIHQVLMNLCSNASFAMRQKGGVLGVSLRDVKFNDRGPSLHPELNPGTYVELTVTDTGEGIDPDILERIFDPFFTTKEQGQGTGMGLSLVHGIVRNYGGTITVESEPGKGTAFHVFIPKIESRTGSDFSVQNRKPEAISGKNERILFIDDEEALVEMGHVMLQYLGYESVSTKSPIEALEIFRSEPGRFDLVITDQTMPQMTGAELAVELMSIRRDIPIILCTGFSESITSEQAKALGIREFVMKPIVAHEMGRIIRKVLDNSKVTPCIEGYIVQKKVF